MTEVDRVPAGTITAIEPVPRRKRRLLLYVDEEPACALESETIERYHLHIGRRIERATWETIFSDDEYPRARDRAFRFLAARPRSRHEVEARLGTYAYAAEVIQRVLQRCQELGYLDDRQFAFWFAEARLARRPEGPPMLRLLLRQRGIANALIDEVIETEFRGDREVELARELASSQVKRYARLPAEQRRIKLAAVLQRRGFGWDAIRQALAEVVR